MLLFFFCMNFRMPIGQGAITDDQHRHHLANFEALKAIDRGLQAISRRRQQVPIKPPLAPNHRGLKRNSMSTALETRGETSPADDRSTTEVNELALNASSSQAVSTNTVDPTNNSTNRREEESSRNSVRRSSNTSSHSGSHRTNSNQRHPTQPSSEEPSGPHNDHHINAPPPHQPSALPGGKPSNPRSHSKPSDGKAPPHVEIIAKPRRLSASNEAPAPPFPQKRIAAPVDDPIVQAMEARLKERRTQEKLRNAEMARRAEVLQQQQERAREEREAREQEKREDDARKKQEQLDERLRLMKQKEDERAARVAQLHLKVDASVLDGKRSTFDIMEERKRRIAEEEQKVLDEKLKAIRLSKRGGGVDMMEDVRQHELLMAQRRAELAEQRKLNGPPQGAGGGVVSLEPIRQVDTKVMARILEEKQAAQGALAEKKEVAKKRLEERRRYAPPPLPPIPAASANPDPLATDAVSPTSQPKQPAHAWGHAPTAALKKVVVSAPQPIPHRKPLKLHTAQPADNRDGVLVPQPPQPVAGNHKNGGHRPHNSNGKRGPGAKTEASPDGDDASREASNTEPLDLSTYEPVADTNGGYDDFSGEDNGDVRRTNVAEGYTRAGRASEERHSQHEQRASQSESAREDNLDSPGDAHVAERGDDEQCVDEDQVPPIEEVHDNDGVAATQDTHDQDDDDPGFIIDFAIVATKAKIHPAPAPALAPVQEPTPEEHNQQNHSVADAPEDEIVDPIVEEGQRSTVEETVIAAADAEGVAVVAADAEEAGNKSTDADEAGAEVDGETDASETRQRVTPDVAPCDDPNIMASESEPQGRAADSDLDAAHHATSSVASDGSVHTTPGAGVEEVPAVENTTYLADPHRSTEGADDDAARGSNMSNRTMSHDAVERVTPIAAETDNTLGSEAIKPIMHDVAPSEEARNVEADLVPQPPQAVPQPTAKPSAPKPSGKKASSAAK